MDKKTDAVLKALKTIKEGISMLEQAFMPVTEKTHEEAADAALEALARELIDHIGEIQNAWHWQNWRKKHARTLSVLLRELPDGPTKKKLVAIGRAKKAQFTNFHDQENLP